MRNLFGGIKMKKDKKGFLAEFKEFAMRGNVLDMAIGVVMATSFGKITSSLVTNVLMPLLGTLIGGFDLTEKLNFVLKPEVTDKAGEVITPEVVLGLGTFLNTIIDFIFIALAIFVMIKIFAKAKEISEIKILKKKQEEEAAADEPKAPTTEELLGEILAELKKNNAEK